MKMTPTKTMMTRIIFDETIIFPRLHPQPTDQDGAYKDKDDKNDNDDDHDDN